MFLLPGSRRAKLVALVCCICLIHLCCVVLPQASEEELIGVFADMIVPHVTLPEGQVSSSKGPR